MLAIPLKDYTLSPLTKTVKAKTNHKIMPCPVCSGRGIRRDAKTGEERQCRACNGTGSIFKNTLDKSK